MYGTATTTRVPDGEMDYLAKAGEQLDKAAQAIDSRATDRYVTKEEISTARQAIANGYALLGAIQRGQLPAALARDLLDRLATDNR
ncbi:hypothetical protein [Micromonospora sp. NPDC047730]|uniref:hypothetical protein n=1 Tax=Micromonospora sp. NPDC047730 TaxID=3364253 RepID=UPI0037224366